MFAADMQVAFRADASHDIGTGHVMRCLTLADSLRSQGASCRFVCRQQVGDLIELVRSRGYRTDILPPVRVRPRIRKAQQSTLPRHAAWLGASWSVDARETRAALGVDPVDLLVVDHYSLDARWERHLRSACRFVLVIDDLADRPHDSDLLLDQNLGRTARDYRELVPPHCAVLAGPEYALLRPEFAALRPYSLARRSSPDLKHLLVSMGGVDRDNATGRVLGVLRSCIHLTGANRLTVVLGPHAPWQGYVREFAADMPVPTNVRVNVTDMATLMAESDLAIGAAGTTSLERCCVGLPALTAVLADNQAEVARALQAAGATMLIGSEGSMVANLDTNLRLASRPDTLRRMQNACASITDGLGTERVTSELHHAIH